MSELVFHSCFASDLEAFIRHKQSLGYLYQNATYLLHQFDRYCTEKSVNSETLTGEIVNGWLSAYPENTDVAIASKASSIRQFSLFLLSRGTKAYIPRHMYTGHHEISHVLSDTEVLELFHEIDSYVPAIKYKPYHRLAYEYRLLFRLLLCCGLRVSEARKLKKTDVDLKTGILKINNSKRQKDRLVYLNKKKKNVCNCYCAEMADVYDDRSEWFFPARDPENLLSVGLIDKRFNEAWNATPSACACSHKPTVHSLRHTFVVKRMNLWMEHDIPLESMMPYLSKFLGHSCVENSFYYYHQVDDAFRTVRSRDRRSELIIPEVTHYEE